MAQNPFDQFDSQPPMQALPIGAADPRRPLEVAKLRGDVARQAQQATSDAALLPSQVRKAEADAAASELDLTTKRREAAMQTTVDPKIAEAIRGIGLTELLASVAEARKEVGTGKATGVTGALMRLIPGTTANDLSGSLNSIQGSVILEKLQALKDASKTGASGMGALSEREGQRLADSIAALGTNLSDEKLLSGLATVERHARALQAVSQGRNPDDPAVRKEFGIQDSAPPAAGSGGNGAGPNDGLGLSGGKTQTVIDPALTGANKRVAAMIKAGASGAEVRSYLDSVQPGLGAKVRNIDEWVAFARQNPGKPINARIDRVERPLTPAGSLLNAAAQSPVGAYAMGAGDFLSGGTLDNLSGNPELARAGMAGVAAQNPYSSLAGQVTGGVLAGLGVEGAAGRLGAGGLASMIAGDALPGVAYGAGSTDEGNRLTGGVTGGLAGLVGGVTGRGAGRLVSGTADPAVQYLANRGIRLTPGQLLGGVPKRIEDTLTSVPFLGDLIRNQRRRGVEDFNRATFSEALQPIGQVAGQQVGEAGVGNAQNLISDAYQNALGGARVSIDPQFGTELGTTVTATQAIPRVGAEVANTLGEVIPPYFDNAGGLTGENMQALLRDLRQTGSAYRNDPLGNRVGDQVRNAEAAVTGMFERQAPEVMPAFNNAQEAFSRMQPVEDAVLAAKNTDGLFMPSQLGTAVVSNTKRFGGKHAAARGDRSFFDLQRNAQNVLPSTLPDSGTASRLMLPGALGLAGGAAGGVKGYADGDTAGGAGGGALTGVALATLLASPYAGRAMLQRALTTERPAVVQNIGRILAQSRLPGALALPLLSGAP